MSDSAAALPNSMSLEDALRGHKAVRESLADQVYNKLRAEIILSNLSPNTHLAQAEIAKQMGTSQAPVREALRQLERDGLVEYRPRSGVFVAELSGDKLFELFAIRSLVETFAIRRAVVHFDRQKCDTMNELIDQMYRAADLDDLVLLVDYDLAFHRCICEWSEHLALLNLWNPLYAQIQRHLIQTQRLHFPDLHDIAKTHHVIVETMCQGDADEAARVVEAHVMMWVKQEGRST
jgi:DNA-binding GntR family transcriptional regulator